MTHLVDGDFASNNGGWQWSASTGTDSQPYFRVFNPTLQSERFDPDGDYIRKWVPELRSIKSKGKSSAIHSPTERLGLARVRDMGYVGAIVKHDMARKRAIEAFKSVLSKK
jgi:deoxyribodipyrimidine photo-lyase